VALQGWEVKAIRAGRAQLKEAYVVVKNGEIVLLGAHVTPLPTASTHIRPDPTRTRKLLLHRAEINRLIGKVERAGYTLTPLDLHFKDGRIKLEIGLAKGKKQYDKREAEKLRDWNREKQRLLRGKANARSRSAR
jgi:SsrA-binding protein